MFVVISDPIYHLGGVPIKPVNAQKDLGVLISRTLKFHQHIGTTVNKAGGVANNLLKSTVNCSQDFMTSLLVTDIRPTGITDFAFHSGTKNI